MSGRGRRSSQSFRGRGRGRGRIVPSSEHTPSPSPSMSTPGISHVAPTIPPSAAPSPQPPATDFQQDAPSPQLNADSSHASQPDPPTLQVQKIRITWDGQKGFDPDNNVCTQAISNVIELMLNEPWINTLRFRLMFRSDGLRNGRRSLRGPKNPKKRSRRPMTTRRGGATSKS
ncbi:hypothetical protein PIB30_060844 [Stylosanthes scabra]|uniref:Uncharacterized protein n=1 Tax=Stylosanthes scabra TaxID=79078 RepID=A0ABU6UK69_9FABA|nr:hypothetical protein [Stylosanthes scabra]